MKNSEFTKAYLSLINEQNGFVTKKKYLKHTHTKHSKKIICESWLSRTLGLDDPPKGQTEEQKKKAEQAAKAVQAASEGSKDIPKEKGWWEKAWDTCAAVVQKTPVLGDLVCICSDNPENGPLIKMAMDGVDAAKDAMTDQEVKDFREALKNDKHLQQMVKKFNVDVNDDDQVKKLAGFLRKQAAIAKKLQDDAEFAKKTEVALKAKAAESSENRKANSVAKKACRKLFKAAEAGEIKDGTYMIHLED